MTHSRVFLSGGRFCRSWVMFYHYVPVTSLCECMISLNVAYKKKIMRQALLLNSNAFAVKVHNIIHYIFIIEREGERRLALSVCHPLEVVLPQQF